MSETSLFMPLRLGAITIPSRIVMAPLTRMRAGVGNSPTELNAEYYAQPSSAVAERLAVRLFPFGQYGGISDSNPLQLFTSVITKLNDWSLAYLHLIEGRGSEIGLTDTPNEGSLNNAKLFRPCFDGPLISAAAYTAESAAQALEQGHADAIAFGRLYIADPDLAERLRDRLPLSAYDRSTFTAAVSMDTQTTRGTHSEP